VATILTEGVIPGSELGAFELAIVLSDRDAAALHRDRAWSDLPLFAVEIWPMLDGPTVLALSPSLAHCGPGRSTALLVITGVMIEPAGQLPGGPAGCADGPVIEALRDAEGRVIEVVARDGAGVTRLGWDRALGVLTPIDP